MDYEEIIRRILVREYTADIEARGADSVGEPIVEAAEADQPASVELTDQEREELKRLRAERDADDASEAWKNR
jgi:hypothetical protein